MKVAIYTLGCKVNQYETVAMCLVTSALLRRMKVLTPSCLLATGVMDCQSDS